jgi:hypothetical protein
MYILRILGAVIALVSSAASALAAQPEPVTLPPIAHLPAELTVVDLSGQEHVYTPADLEALGSVRLTTTTPWRDEPAVFEGALLKDLLAAHGLDTVDAIQVVAENDFHTIVERSVWENVDVVLATRVDGRAHSRRTRGPIQFVVSDSVYMTSGHVQERHLVWMAARIQAAD